MTRNLACVVEGHGDALSVPIILRRIAAEREGIADLLRIRPYRIPRSTLVRPGEIERAVERAARESPPGTGVLVVIDADDDPPCRLGPQLQARAQAARPDRPVAVVLANREKEA